MLIRCLQYASILVLAIPVVSVFSKIKDLSGQALGLISLCSICLVIISLLIKLKNSIFQQLSWLPHFLAICLFLFLLWDFSGRASHFLLAVYLAGIHAFALHWLVTNGHPLKSKLWADMNHLEKAAIWIWVAIQTIALPIFIIWLWYFVLFSSSADREHMASFAFYVGIPMTFVAAIFSAIYLSVQYFMLREVKPSNPS